MQNTLTTLVILLIIGSLSSYAQELNYYAIDGNKYKTVKERDLHEELLWKEVDMNLLKMYFKDQLDIGDRNTEILNSLTQKNTHSQKLISSLREFNQDILQTEITPKQLLDTGIEIRPFYANNGEMFTFAEITDLFNLIIDDFHFCDDLTKNMIGKEPSKSTVLELMKELAGRQDKFNQELNIKSTVYSQKIDEIVEILSESNTVAKRVAPKKASATVYYAIDGRACTTKQERDEYEQKLYQKLTDILNQASTKEAASELANHTKNKVAPLVFGSPSQIRDANKIFEELLTKKGRSKIIYKAENREEFYSPELKNCFNYAIGMYNIVCKETSDIDEIWAKNSNSESNYIPLNSKKTGLNGYTMQELSKMITKEMDVFFKVYTQIGAK